MNSCPLLHRTAGDTERRYHLRYYKTGTCVYETDTRGHCVKNGAHCAFAHGANDIRPPVYDKNEVPGLEILENSSSTTQDSSAQSTSSTSSSSAGSVNMDKEKQPADDPKWNGQSLGFIAFFTFSFWSYGLELCLFKKLT